MKKKAKDAILALVEKERDGEQIDRALLKNVLVPAPCRAPAPPAAPPDVPARLVLVTTLCRTQAPPTAPLGVLDRPSC